MGAKSRLNWAIGCTFCKQIVDGEQCGGVFYDGVCAKCGANKEEQDG